MKRLLFFLSALTLFLLPGIAQGAEQPQVIWLITDKLSLDELNSAKTPNIDYLQKKGAFSLMNVRTAGRLQTESAYLSAGAGKKCLESKYSQTGRNIGSAVLNNQISLIKEDNKGNNYNPEIGLWGKIARENDLKIAVLGNSDTYWNEKRTVVAMLMDENGYIPRGDVGKDLLTSLELSKYPWGYQTNWQAIKKRYYQYTSLVDALVIETGDLSRIEEFRGQLPVDMINFEKQKALERVDSFLGFLLTQLDLTETQIGIIVPTPPDKMIRQGARLSWLLLAGRNICPGYLSTSTTRRKGVIRITDLLSIFMLTNGIKQEMKIISYPGKFSWSELKLLNKRITLISKFRPVFIKGFILLQLLLIIIAILGIVWGKFKTFSIINFISEYLLIAVLFVPFNYLIISNLPILTAFAMIFSLLFLTLVELIVVEGLIRHYLYRVVFIALLTILTIGYDLFHDYSLMADSLLGYSSIIGARFYGIGNEYMGIFIGGFLISFTGLIEIIRDYKNGIEKYLIPAAVPIFLSIVYLIGSPTLGANFGGMVTFLLAGGITYYYLSGKKNVFRIILLSLIVFLLIIYLDYSGFLRIRSHIGQAVFRIIQGDWQYILLVIKRKLSMNLKLLRWTIWTRVIFAFIIYLLFVFKKPGPRLKDLFIKRPYLKAGFFGGLAGSIVTILVNDSGVVASATILFFPMLTLLYLYK
ncbi:hypothetical protein GM661_11635 [Iocasia frigidifontis]|uniref:Uncharacterized protein n=1 Tax=Iocasia fonsfrigidae TaxID=2682810 RepID=A0A8A7KBF5_9FIRM|nr:hypothetical protein [Iocasia fonsfrigidae]QTL98570.1 hypothetical protein GM661_11635 [Iocasia fonsfrigidae]